MTNSILVIMGFVLILSLVVLILVLLSSRSTHLTVRFILPNGYRGAFVVIPHAPDGNEPTMENGEFTLTVPESGKLKLTNDPFQGWQVWKAFYANGDTIPDIASSPPDADTVGFGGLYSEGDGRTWFFIGTEAEIRNAAGNHYLSPGSTTTK